VDGRSVERPDWAALTEKIGDLRAAVGKIGETQQQLLALRGTAWSTDRLVKAVVGPRGHLIELDIDPRVYRTPNSKALAATILATVRDATDQVLAQAQEITGGMLPSDMQPRRDGGLDLWKLAHTHDADLSIEGS
jgi:DNA-binding protein YbaB